MNTADNPMAPDNAMYGSYGAFEPVPDDVDWAAHDAEADAFFAEREDECPDCGSPYPSVCCDTGTNDPDDVFEWDAVSQGMYDDDPSPYAGDYSEM